MEFIEGACGVVVGRPECRAAPRARDAMFQRCRISSRRVVAAGAGGAFNEGQRLATLIHPN
ncbi:MAG TPA: hypothetical protein VIN75_12855, partial [Burkholderiaceae bacterium]